VEPIPGVPVRTASGAVVAHADLDGTRQPTVDGTPVTPQGLQLRAVLGVDGEEVLFGASREPTETHLWAYVPGGGAAPLLTRPLMLIHGLDDDNVHPAHTLRLSEALLAAGRPHEVLLLPGVGHQGIGSAVTPGLLGHQLRFLRRHLGPGTPPSSR
jgi:pimeloyl-ACP methyl ester carboxylesterase